MKGEYREFAKDIIVLHEMIIAYLYALIRGNGEYILMKDDLINKMRELSRRRNK